MFRDGGDANWGLAVWPNLLFANKEGNRHWEVRCFRQQISGEAQTRAHTQYAESREGATRGDASDFIPDMTSQISQGLRTQEELLMSYFMTMTLPVSTECPTVTLLRLNQNA